MAKIRQYFAPITELAPDREGWTAFERSARAEQELFGAVGRDYETIGQIEDKNIRDLSWPMDVYRLQADLNRTTRGGGVKIKNPPPQKQAPDPTVYWQNPDGDLEAVKYSQLNEGDVAFMDQNGEVPVRGYSPQSSPSDTYAAQYRTHRQISGGAAAIGQLAAQYGSSASVTTQDGGGSTTETIYTGSSAFSQFQKQMAQQYAQWGMPMPSEAQQQSAFLRQKATQDKADAQAQQSIMDEQSAAQDWGNMLGQPTPTRPDKTQQAAIQAGGDTASPPGVGPGSDQTMQGGNSGPGIIQTLTNYISGTNSATTTPQPADQTADVQDDESGLP